MCIVLGTVRYCYTDYAIAIQYLNSMHCNNIHISNETESTFYSCGREVSLALKAISFTSGNKYFKRGIHL